MTDQENVFYLQHGKPRKDDFQFFPELMIDKNVMATVTPDEIVIKLVKKEAMTKCEKGLWQEALLFAQGNARGDAQGTGRGRKSGRGDQSDENEGDRNVVRCPVS
jgi:hypothetical protein